MAPKKSIATKISEEKELKAVVLADSFDDLFQPLALNKPRCLLPLCNVPMIEYTLEFLAASGVSEAILICKSHSEKLLAYIRQSKWKRSSTPMKVNTTVAQSATSVCDALRNIDESRVITSDFILCTGLVVSNMDLSGLVAAHLANKSRDRNQIMTMLLREAASTHRLFDKSDESVYIIEPSTSRLLAVNTSPSLPRAQDVDIPTNAIIYKMPKVEPRAGFIDTNESVYSPEVELRADLIDTHVSICSPEVLSLLTENFDYQVMRRDFVHRTLASDLLSSTIYAHILTGSSSVLSEAASAAAATATTPDALIPSVGALDLSAGGGITFASHSGYAAGVADTAAYDAISRDLIGRWAYPLCPDSNPIDGPPYSYHRGAVYKTPSVFLGRESRVDHHVILGPNSHVADHARVFDSVLGSGCRVSGQSVVHGSYLFDGASVGRGSVVEKSILGERVTILENVVIERGCLIGDDVVIGPNVRIAAFSRISRRAPQSSQVPANNEFDSYSEASDDSDVEESDDSDDTNVARNKDHPVASHASTSGQSGQPSSAGIEVFDTQTLGASGVGYVWVDDAEADSDLEDDISDEELDSRIRILRSIGSNLNDVELANAELAAEDSVEQHEWQPESAFAQDSQEHFEYELILTINTVLEGRSTEMTITDIRTFRMTCNADQDRIRPIVLEEVLNAIDLAALPSSAKTTLAKAVQLIKWGINSGAEQIDAISIIERHCATNSAVDDDVRGRLFKVVVCVLYELDILEDLAIISWYNRSLKKPDSEVSRKLLDTIKAFVDMLNESEDEDESDDEDSSSEE